MEPWYHWSPAEDAKLLASAEVREPRKYIAARLGRTKGACDMRLMKLRNAMKRERRSIPPAPKLPKSEVKPKRTYVKQARPAKPVIGSAILQAPPSAKLPRTVSVGVLMADQELRDRIRERGLTGGLLGDPAPGRSALDQRSLPKPPVIPPG